MLVLVQKWFLKDMPLLLAMKVSFGRASLWISLLIKLFLRLYVLWKRKLREKNESAK